MLVRSVPRCSSRVISPAWRAASARRTCAQRRPYSATANPASSSSNSISMAGGLAPFTNELDKIAPSFPINGSKIRVLQTPSEFYETLKTKIRGAKRRIFLATLYIGKEEKELIEVLQEALRGNPNLTLSILTDALRGTREAPNPSSASLLAPLIAEFGPQRVDIRMYHTPNLTGLRKRAVPKRINEGWGLQHMKLYGMDDEVILSGANLSTDYFTNRQDRYHLFSSKTITEYFCSLHNVVSSLSFQVKPAENAAGFDLQWPSTNNAVSPLEDRKRFTFEATERLRNMIQPGRLVPSRASSVRGDDNIPDTTVYVLSQLSQLLRPDISTELPAITSVLEMLSKPEYSRSSWFFTAGYFNPAPSLTKLLLSTASQNNTVVTASPFANGFYKSAGVSGLLPDAYTLLARRFVHAVHRRNKETSTALREWRKGTVGEPGGWTYHAKGLWVTLPDDERPSITLVGSSNYTKRSYSLDLEANAMIVTQNAGLKQRLADEQKWLSENTTVVTRDDFAKNDRRVGIKVRIAMAIVSLLGGAL